MGKKSIGIDLGTFNSAGAYALNRDRIVMVKSHDRESIYGKNFPSFVLFDENGKKVSVGVKAFQEICVNPELVVWGVKRLIGLSYEKARTSKELLRFQYKLEKSPDGSIQIVVGKKKYTPIDILAFILKEIKDNAENPALNPLIAGETIESVVVSVPAYFDVTRVAPIIEAANRVGFKEVSTISEPTAAAQQYGIQINSEAFVLTFDMGAGTLDVTVSGIANVGGTYVQGEIAVSGHEALGGIDIDEILYAYIDDIHNLSSFEDDPKKIAILKQAIQWAKIQLSTKEEASILLPSGQEITLTRNELERTIDNFLDNCRGPIQVAIKNSGISPDEILAVLFVGGPTAMPCIRRTVINEIKSLGASEETVKRLKAIAIDSHTKINPMECVAKGAALKAGGFVTIDVTIDPNGYGTILTAPGLQDCFFSVIEPNSGYPVTQKAIIWQNDPDTQCVTIPIVKKLEYARMGSIVPRYYHLGDIDCFIKPTGNYPEILIEMTIDARRSLKTQFTHVETGESVSFSRLDQLKGDEIFLQENVPVPPENIPDGRRNSQVNRWSAPQYEEAVKIARIIADKVGDECNDEIVKEKRKDLYNQLKEAKNFEDTRFILRKTQELLDALRISNIINQDEFSYHMGVLRQIVFKYR